MGQLEVLQQQQSINQRNSTLFNDISFGFMPAFKNLRTLQIHLSTDRNGEISVVHRLDGVPFDWVEQWDSYGDAISLKSEIIVGFMRHDRFFTLGDILHRVKDD